MMAGPKLSTSYSTSVTSSPTVLQAGQGASASRYSRVVKTVGGSVAFGAAENNQTSHRSISGLLKALT